MSQILAIKASSTMSTYSKQECFRTISEKRIRHFKCPVYEVMGDHQEHNLLQIFRYILGGPADYEDTLVSVPLSIVSSVPEIVMFSIMGRDWR